MRTKKSVAVICILLMLSILLTACDSSGKGGKDVIFEGNPDTKNADENGFMYQKDLETRWVDEPMIQGVVDWDGDLDPGQYVSIVCRMNDDINEQYKLSKKLMKAYCFERNDDYTWNKSDALFSKKPVYYQHSENDTKGNSTSWYGYDFQIDLPKDIKPGKYTFALVREDNVVELMIDFCVPMPPISRPYSDDPIPVTTEKPVIYLYPQSETDISIVLDYDGTLTCTYPEYNAGWNVTALPDGTIFDKNTGRYYEYLFWEGTRSFDDYEFSHAACVAREDTASFLEEYLEAAGLNDREIDDFVSYWLPRLQASPYNLISFPSEEYCDWAKLNVDPAPDTLIRVYMVFAPLESPVEIPDSMMLELPSTPERQGFTVVEWGGSVLYDQDAVPGN